MTCNDIVLTVNDDGIDKAKLPNGGSQLIDLLLGVGPGIVLIRNQLGDRHKLHFTGCLAHQNNPHSANFSKPPTERI